MYASLGHNVLIPEHGLWRGEAIKVTVALLETLKAAKMTTFNVSNVVYFCLNKDHCDTVGSLCYSMFNP